MDSAEREQGCVTRIIPMFVNKSVGHKKKLYALIVFIQSPRRFGTEYLGPSRHGLWIKMLKRGVFFTNH